MIITITGTPGTGKTYIAKKLARMTGYRNLELNKMIVKEKLYDSYDNKDKTFDVDTKKLSKFMDMILRKYEYDKHDASQANAYNALKRYADKNIDMRKFDIKLSHNKKNNKKDNIKNNKKDYINNIIIDSHLSQYIKSDFCLVV